ncbi:MAG: ribosome maturation factor RimP [Methyloligellaceae bacterium]
MTENTRFADESGIELEIAKRIEPVIDELGFRLIRIHVSGRDGTTLQIMAERQDGTMNVDDCATISRELSPILDAEDFVDGSYNLEVSSPGIDRPLVCLKDFEDWQGYEAKVELNDMVDGRKRFRGLIEGAGEQEARLRVKLDEFEEAQTIGLHVSMIRRAKLVMTDELVRAALAAQKSS